MLVVKLKMLWILILLTFVITINAYNVHTTHNLLNKCKRPFTSMNDINKCLSKQNINSMLYSTANDNINVSNYNNSNNNVLMNIPNILTISRIVIIPFFIIAFITKKITLSTVIFIITCITDLLDGIIARKLNQTSSFGAFLDPVADKLMVATALIMLTLYFPVWWYGVPVVITLCREIAVSAIREWMAQKGQRDSVKVGSIGKIKTATQMISIATLLQACSTMPQTHILGKLRPMFFSIGFLLLYISTFLCTWSGILYFLSAKSSFTDSSETK